MSTESIKSNEGKTEKKLPPRKPNFFSGYILGIVIGALIMLLAFLTENAIQGFFLLRWVHSLAEVLCMFTVVSENNIISIILIIRHI